MKLASIRSNLSVMESGEWVKDIPEMEDLELKVRPLFNPDYRALQGRLVATVPRGKRVRGIIEQGERDRIEAICLRDTVLLDWRNLDDVEYSKEQAFELLTNPEYAQFRASVLYAANVVDESRKEDTEDAAKN